jgi:hypothetical protein
MYFFIAASMGSGLPESPLTQEIQQVGTAVLKTHCRMKMKC